MGSPRSFQRAALLFSRDLVATSRAVRPGAVPGSEAATGALLSVGGVRRPCQQMTMSSKVRHLASHGEAKRSPQPSPKPSPQLSPQPSSSPSPPPNPNSKARHLAPHGVARRPMTAGAMWTMEDEGRAEGGNAVRSSRTSAPEEATSDGSHRIASSTEPVPPADQTLLSQMMFANSEASMRASVAPYGEADGGAGGIGEMQSRGTSPRGGPADKAAGKPAGRRGGRDQGPGTSGSGKEDWGGWDNPYWGGGGGVGTQDLYHKGKGRGSSSPGRPRSPPMVASMMHAIATHGSLPSRPTSQPDHRAASPRAQPSMQASPRAPCRAAAAYSQKNPINTIPSRQPQPAPSCASSFGLSERARRVRLATPGTDAMQSADN